MSTSEQRIKEAFDALQVPEGLKEKTLKAIEEQGQLQGSFTPSDSKDISATPVVKKTLSLRWRKTIFAAAACLLLSIIGFGGFNVYATETAVVGIEVNPSVELGINCFDIVIDTRALNEDGEVLLEGISVVGKNYDEALVALTQSNVFLSYVTESSFVDVYVLCDDDRQSVLLVDRGWENISTLPCEGRCDRISSELRGEAGSYGMGVSRYETAQALIILDPTLTIDDCAQLSMKELRDRITELDSTNEYAWQGSGQGKGYSNGQHHGGRYQGRNTS